MQWSYLLRSARMVCEKKDIFRNLTLHEMRGTDEISSVRYAAHSGSVSAS
jgi:hypothetical protein